MMTNLEDKDKLCDRLDSVISAIFCSDKLILLGDCNARVGTAHQGPVVQSVVSLTSSLRVISLTVLADSIYNILIFFSEKKCE